MRSLGLIRIEGASRGRVDLRLDLHPERCARSAGALLLLLVSLATLTLLLAAGSAEAQRGPESGKEMVSLDFSDVELPVVVDTISRMTGYNFIYDDRVRGRVTIVSPTEVTVDQAFAVFESVLKVKGFSLVLGPGDTYKILPIRDIKESSVDTIKDDRPSPNRDRFVTRLVPLRFIDAEAITQTIKPLISKDASLVAYEATNTIIVTDSESNIRRLLSILDAIDVESYRQELAVLKIEFADANIMAEQLSEIYGAEVASAAGGATAAQRRARSRRRTTATAGATDSASPIGPTVRILPDERTNSLLVLASRQQLSDIRDLVEKLDIPVTGEGRIQVYYLRHADAEELSETLNSLVGSGGGGGARSSLPGAASNATQSIRSAVTPLDEGITVTADAATNALVIKASKEGYETLKNVIEKLDVSRPQVLVEALIVEVDVTDNLSLGFDIAYRIINGDTDLLFQTGAAFVPGGSALAQAARSGAFEDVRDAFDPSREGFFSPDSNGKSVGVRVNATASDNDINIVSAPHILTSDNEEAEIIIGDNIPIVTGRTEAATGGNNLSQAVNVERQDVGVTLRVTPQISEGNTLRLNIFQEITEVTSIPGVGDPAEVGASLSNRKIENTVVVNDGETVAVGGLIDETYTENVTGVPFMKDIPWLGWFFKTRSQELRKTNLLIFLTPHIIRSAEDLERETIRKRLELEDRLGDSGDFAELEDWEQRKSGRDFAVAEELSKHAERYPLERMRELEEQRAQEIADRKAEQERQAEASAQRYSVQVATFLDENEATESLMMLVDAGYDGTLVSSESDGQIVFTIEVGPFQDLWEADRAAQTLEAAYDYETSITILRGETK